MFICKNCNTIFNKPFKIVINICRKNLLIENQIFHIVKIVKICLCINIFLQIINPL